MPPAVWFVYSEDRKGEHPKLHLSTFSGILQADGYAGFHHLYEGGRIVEAACWALDDGQIELDNSAAERALRAVALGRKNFLFAGSDSGGERAACLYSLLGTAKLNGLDPELYLREILGRIGEHPINRITELLPWNFLASLG